MSNITVILPCKPALALWLTRKYGNPVTFPRKSNELAIFQAALQKKYHPSREYDRITYPDQVEVTTAGHSRSEHGATISITLQHFINRWFENLMTLELYEFVNMHRMNGHSINGAIRLYQRHYGFTEEQATFDALEKKYDRYKSRIRKNIFSQSVPKNKNSNPIKPINNVPKQLNIFAA